MNYLVALDNSAGSRTAFYSCLSHLNQKRDKLFLISVCSDLLSMLYGPYVPYEQFVQAQKQAEVACKKILNSYLKEARAFGVETRILLGISNEIGEVICKAVKQKNIDFLYIGRRGMSTVKRFFMGSTSKYVVENAECNVMVIKDDHDKEQHIVELIKQVKEKIQHDAEEEEPDVFHRPEEKKKE